MVKSAGLMRAYAVLQRLELLRQQDILDPLPLETATDDSNNSGLSATECSHISGDSFSSPLVFNDMGPAENAAGVGSDTYTGRTHCDSDVERLVRCSSLEKCDVSSRCEDMSCNSDAFLPDGEEEKVKGKKEGTENTMCLHTYNGATGESDSFPGSFAPEKSCPLRHVLQEVVMMRKHASRSEKTRDHGEEGLKKIEKRGSVNLSCSFYGGSKDILTGSFSSLKENLEKDVFFDESDILFANMSLGTKDGMETESCEKSSVENFISSYRGGKNNYDNDDGSRRKEQERSSEKNEKAVGNISNVNRVKKDIFRGSVLNNKYHKDVSSSQAYSVVSDYANSLLSHYKKHAGKVRKNLFNKKVQRCNYQQEQQHKERDDNDDQFLASQEATAAQIGVLSTISCIDDRDEGFSPFQCRGLEFEFLQNNNVINSPLMSFLCKLTAIGSEELKKILCGMAEDLCDRDVFYCRNWLALTALVNTDEGIRNVVVPLLISELLSRRCNAGRHRVGENNSRVSNILCALIGCGELAVASLPTLLDMLKGSFGCTKLVALAIRAVGGSDGVRELCAVARDEKLNFKVRAAAVYGISLLAYPVLGHTNIYCIGAPRLNNTIAFYQPPVSACYLEVDKNGKLRSEPSLQLPPPYRPTHVILCTELVRKLLLQLVSLRGFEQTMQSYTLLSLVIRDFSRDAPEACRHQDVSENVLSSLYYEIRELGESLPAFYRVLKFSYDPHFIGHEDELFLIEETLIALIHDKQTPLNVVEQSLVSIASLPDFVTIHIALPVLDYIIHYVASLERRHGDAKDEAEAEAVIVAGLVTLGRLVRSENAAPSVTDTACELLLHNLASLRPRVRHSACIGLGEAGVVVNRPRGEITRALTCCLDDAAMDGETVAWALARLGVCGVRVLLDHIASGSINNREKDESSAKQSVHVVTAVPIYTRLACLGALARVDLLDISLGIYEEARRLQREIVKCFTAVILSDRTEEEVAVECAYTLGNVISANLKDEKVEKQERHDEAATYYKSETPNEAFVVLKGIVESASCSRYLYKVLFYLLCMYGGAHGELCASQTAIQSLVAELRAAAAFGLRACGAKIIRTLVIALNDDDANVRFEAFDTLNTIGVEAVLAVLRLRPEKHRQQVTAALRDCLLRDICRGVNLAVAQSLYAILKRA